MMGKLFPMPLEAYPPAADGILKCYLTGRIDQFPLYVPYNEDRYLTNWFIDHISPSFVAIFLVENSIIETIKLPEGLKISDGEFLNFKTDISPNQLILLKTMGYTRWPEVRQEIIKRNFDTSQLSMTKRTLLKELDLID